MSTKLSVTVTMAVLTLANKQGPFNANRIGSICVGFPKVAKVSTSALAFDGKQTLPM
jgi:hypothetical protein